MALFVHRYYSDPLRVFAVADNPVCVSSEQAGFIGDEDYVVGVTIGILPANARLLSATGGAKVALFPPAHPAAAN